jgi:exonuclease VII small subunit
LEKELEKTYDEVEGYEEEVDKLNQIIKSLESLNHKDLQKQIESLR